jgi:pantoate--beta-alanine ligase
MVVTQMAKDLDLSVKIVGVPTVREPDGLALSSRNAYLSASDRAAAPALHRVLKQCAAAIAQGGHLAQVLDEGGAAIEAAGFTLDYLEARNAATLEQVENATGVPIRLLVAARIGKARLIDNMPA